MADFYEQSALGTGAMFGTTLVQGKGNIGGHRHVFVGLQGGGKNGLVFPPIGGVVVNPFKGRARAFAGDLCEYRIDGSVYILKTFEVATSVETGSRNVALVRDGYHHVPFEGDILASAPTDVDTPVVGKLVQSVTEGDGVWNVVFAEPIEGAMSAGSFFVEAKAMGADSNVMVQNPNSFLPCDYDFGYVAVSGPDDFNGAKYLITPCLANEDTKLIVSQMTKLPECYLSMNKSLVKGWFNL